MVGTGNGNPALPRHFDLLQSNGRADSDAHSLADRWFGSPAMQLSLASPKVAAHSGGWPVK